MLRTVSNWQSGKPSRYQLREVGGVDSISWEFTNNLCIEEQVRWSCVGKKNKYFFPIGLPVGFRCCWLGEALEVRQIEL